jgi:uncharacterized protein YigE (DUF2233 family)
VRRLGFAMNAGMYHDDRRPVGHYVEDGVEEMRVITRTGRAISGCCRTGSCACRPGRADVIESRPFAQDPPDCTHATQSGPMLVIDGACIRGSCPTAPRAISATAWASMKPARVLHPRDLGRKPVNFHHFARLFRDHLGLPNALYFDGNGCRGFTRPDIGRADIGHGAHRRRGGRTRGIGRVTGGTVVDARDGRR